MAETTELWIDPNDPIDIGGMFPFIRAAVRTAKDKGMVLRIVTTEEECKPILRKQAALEPLEPVEIP